MNKWTFALAGLLAVPLSMKGQLTMNETLTPSQLVTDVLVGQGVTITNIEFNGVIDPPTPQAQTGSFQTISSNLGLDAGLVLSTGGMLNIAGPEIDFVGGTQVQYTDPDLVLLSGGTINNAAVLEFDFIPNGDTIKFSYVFGSEEYPEWICSFNDVFGFFLSGPGIAGGFGYENDAINLALVPGTSTYVGINTINNGDNDNPLDPFCPAVNPEYYVNNDNGTTVAFDAFTTVLLAKSEVECGQQYHIKLAIGNALDQGFQSGVFLEAGSFSTSPFIPSLTPGPGIVGDTLMESCFDVGINFVRIGDSTGVDTVNMIITGTAIAGVDYAPPLPSQLIFENLVTEIPFFFNAPIDADGLETIIITLQTLSPCSDDTINSVFTFYISQIQPLIVIGEAIQIPCGGTTTLVPNLSGGYGAFNYVWSTGETTPTITVTPDNPSDYYVQVVDTCGVQSDGYFAVSFPPIPPINISLSGSPDMIEGCDGPTVIVYRPNGASGDMTIDFESNGQAQIGPDFMMTDPMTIMNGQNQGSSPVVPLNDTDEEGTEQTWIVATWIECGQEVSDSVSVTITDSPQIELTIPEDQIIHCSPDSVMLVAQAIGGTGGLSYTWNTGDNGPITYGLLEDDNWYTVIVTDACGHTMVDSTFINIQCEVVIPNVISPNNGDGLNDVWFIEGLEGSQNSVRIYNRWGKVVFETTNYQNNWSAKDLSDGTYFYEVKVDTEPDPLTGHLTILSNGRRTQ